MSNGHYAVVTGASKGIGKAISTRLLEEGFYVIGSYFQDDGSAEDFRREVARLGQLTLIKQRLSDYADLLEFTEQVKKLCSAELDILVCNSATTDITPFLDITWEGWSYVLNTNLSIPFFLAQSLYPIIAPNRGRVIFIGSSMGQYPHARSIGYGITKAGIEMLVKYLVKYFSLKKATVNCVAPSFVDTSWHKNKDKELRKRIEDKIALHRFADTFEVADLCLSVIHNQYINGSILPIDGGYCFE